MIKASHRAALLALVLTLAACGRQAVTERPPERGDVAVAKVGAQTVWKSDVTREAVTKELIGEGEPLDMSSDLFRRMLDEVIDQKLLAAEALKQRLDRDPVVQRRVAVAREGILGDMVVERAVDSAVSESAIRALYNEQVSLSRRSEEFHARQIVVATRPEGDGVKKLLVSGAAFDPLALERSTDAATRFNGGDLNYFSLDVMSPPYQAALKDAKTGDIVGPFQTEAGWVVMKVEDRRQEQPLTLEESRPQIVRFVTFNEVRELLENLRAKTKVTMLIGPPQDIPGAPKEPASAPPSPPSPPAQPAKPAEAKP